MIIRDRLVDGGVEWIEKPGANVLNTYKPPTLVLGDPGKAKRWVDHWHTIYPDEADYIIKWLAYRVQRPGVKINHALLLGSEKQGIGKDTLLMGALHTRSVPATTQRGRAQAAAQQLLQLRAST